MMRSDTSFNENIIMFDLYILGQIVCTMMTKQGML